MSNPNSLITLKEAARRLGVSVATVSNAFNRPDQLSQDLRHHILSSCQAWGYNGPQASSRKRRTDKTKVVGVMLSNSLSYSFSDPMANRMLEGLADVFESTDYNLLVIPSRESLKSLDGMRGFVDGFIVYGPPADDRLALLMEHKRSIIAIDFYAPEVTSVNIDNRAAARRIASHALSHPISNIAVLGLRTSRSADISRLYRAALLDANSHIMVQRLQGFEDAIASSGHTVCDNNIWHIPDNRPQLAKLACQEMFSSAPLPDLLLCMSDKIALAASEVATEKGLTVGKDILITGFDGIDEAVTASPSITTIAQPHREKGRIAAELFTGQITPQDQVLPVELKVRNSCPYYSR